jgi:2-polyprenyl-3-methyl-5-hydroxy-6-metoxy-1,4-benzoquinol methylase
MKCRFCETTVVHTFIDLGTSPPSNSFIEEGDLNSPEIYYPLKAMVCPECLLVQLDEYKNNKDIFNDKYVYFSSYSQSWLKHAREYVEMISKKLKLSDKSQVIEIASNDGYLLQYFIKSGIPCLGIEPTSNTAHIAQSKGIETIVDFFDVNMANKLKKDGKSADLIIGNNVLAHDPHLNELVMGLKTALKENGVVTMEFPHLLNIIEQNQFDTIYHEHYSYFSLFIVIKIFEHHGLKIFDVEEIPTHGGSLRIYAKHSENQVYKVFESVNKLLEKERNAGLHNIDGYNSFQGVADDIKIQFLRFLLECKYEKKKVVGYGAAAKGNTLLNYCGVKNDLISFVIDASEHKKNKYLPGSRIGVVDEARLKEFEPDYVIIFPWNIKDEIMDQLAYIRDWGGKFVIPIPKLTVI